MTEDANISQINNRRIAKNTVMLYFRMFLTMVVGLYTSRVVLHTLGVEDYGIYGVVGGVVGMLGFLNASMSGATSRFLTFELGLGHMERLKKTFSSALIVHCIVALIVFVIAETAGLWFLNHKLVIPEGRMHAAHVVYQLSILSTMIGITQVPYNASIIAHEKMDVYAYVEILNVSLKLGIVFLLVIGNFDKLILYSILTFVVSVIVMMVYRIYCIRKFEECHFHWVWEKEYLKPMLSFSGWDLYGNSSVVFFTQGTSIVLNMFLGPAINAANNISNTVQGIIKGFTSNVIQAFRPQIIKHYAQGDMNAVNHYCIMSTQVTLVLFAFLAVPVFFNTQFILRLWLGEVPKHSADFLRVVLIATFFNLANNVVNIPIHACGRMKFFSIATGTCLWGAVLCLYCLMKLDIPVSIAYFTIFFAYFTCFFVAIIFLKRNVPSIRLRRLFVEGYLKSFIVILMGMIGCYFVGKLNLSDWQYLMASLSMNTILLILGFAFVMMNKYDRTSFVLFLKNH